MEELHVEGVASRDGPVSCDGVREDVVEALNRGMHGRDIELRNRLFRGADAVRTSGRQYGGHRDATCSTALRSLVPAARAEPSCARSGR